MKTRCYECMFLNWDFLSGEYWPGDWFCGLHGGAPVDPNGNQPDLNHHGSCGFIPLEGQRQFVIPPYLM